MVLGCTGWGGSQHVLSSYGPEKPVWREAPQEWVGKDGSSLARFWWGQLVGGTFLVGLGLWQEVLGTVRCTVESPHSGQRGHPGVSLFPERR